VGQPDLAVPKDKKVGPKKDGKVVQKDKAVVQKDKAVVQKDKGVIQKDKAVVQKDKTVVQKDITQPDLTPPPDTALPPDLTPPPDQALPPDSVAWQCKTNIDCDDKLLCTQDICTPQKKCTNKLWPGTCIIGPTCYKQNDVNPSNSCQVCAPSSNTMAWTAKANGLACKSDNLWCTVDACQGGQCTHKTKASACLIGGACYAENDTNSKNSCQQCTSLTSTTAWSNKKDGTTCPGDGLTCTSDVCATGKCTHKLTTGCLINKVCVGEGAASSSDLCKECRSAESTSAYTFTSGKFCTSGNTVKMCAANKCRTFTHGNVDGNGSTNSTYLRRVAYVPKDKSYWAAGTYRVSYSNNDGILVDVGTVIGGGLQRITSGSRLHAVGLNLVVGDSGDFRYNDGTTWKTATALKTAMGNHSRYALWGTTVSSKEVYYIGGTQSGSTAGVYRCEATSGAVSGTVSCAKMTGIVNGVSVGNLTGTLKGTAQGPLWGIPNSGNDDIYYNAGTGTAWTRSGPHGCQDTGSTPCANSATDWKDIHALSATDVWVVGTNGWILRYDGNKWGRVSGAWSGMSGHTISAVYGSAKEKLVTVATYVNTTSSNRQVRIFNYNITMNKWFGPAGIQNGSSYANTPNEIMDIAGDDYNELFMVGRRRTGSGYNAKYRGWVVRVK